MGQLGKFTRYEDFWSYYLIQHSRPWTRRLHALGLVLGLATAGLLVISGRPGGIFFGLIPGYGLAWLSHGLIEKNRPATQLHFFWSLISDFRMTFLLLTGRLEMPLENSRKGKRRAG